jgi:exosortase F-associated protein
MTVRYRILLSVVCLIGLLLVFVFQQYNLAGTLFRVDQPLQVFLINRSFRFLLNDFFAIGVIYSLFPIRKYLFFAVAVQIAGLLTLLLPYFIIKIYLPAYNGPMINFFHRIILNPVLMILLIPAFYYQRRIENATETRT